MATCKYCYDDNLEWEKDENGWYLVNQQGDWHTCLDPDPSVSEMDAHRRYIPDSMKPELIEKILADIEPQAYSRSVSKKDRVWLRGRAQALRERLAELGR